MDPRRELSKKPFSNANDILLRYQKQYEFLPLDKTDLLPALSK